MVSFLLCPNEQVDQITNGRKLINPTSHLLPLMMESDPKGGESPQNDRGKHERASNDEEEQFVVFNSITFSILSREGASKVTEGENIPSQPDLPGSSDYFVPQVEQTLLHFICTLPYACKLRDSCFNSPYIRYVNMYVME